MFVLILITCVGAKNLRGRQPCTLSVHRPFIAFSLLSFHEPYLLIHSLLHTRRPWISCSEEFPKSLPPLAPPDPSLAPPDHPRNATLAMVFGYVPNVPSLTLSIVVYQRAFFNTQHRCLPATFELICLVVSRRVPRTAPPHVPGEHTTKARSLQLLVLVRAAPTHLLIHSLLHTRRPWISCSEGTSFKNSGLSRGSKCPCAQGERRSPFKPDLVT